MEATIKRTTEDIIYAGNESGIAQTIQLKYPAVSFRQITNDKELMAYLQDRMNLFSTARGCGLSGLQLQKGIYPKVLLIAPDLPESKNSERTVPIGPGTVAAARENLRFVEAYVLVNDEAYAMNKKGLRSCCEGEPKIPVIKESELENRLNEILEEKIK
ncbi:MAG: hypothetical protein WC781_04605 [Candidatus Pacearchaeota archaeon]|jgi:hypothetical protein